jgi:energy-coupling factor transporter transmembrane protein EcfT
MKDKDQEFGDRLRCAVSPGLCLWSILASILLFFINSFVIKLLFVGISLSVLFSTVQSKKPIRRFIGFFTPFAIPLFFIHTFVNTSFAADYYVWEVLPIRFDGARYALKIATQLATLLSVSMMCLYTDSDRFLDWLISRKFPLLLCATFAQAIAVIHMIERKGLLVYKAQQGRGVQTGPGIFRKIRVLPSVIFPVITTVLQESEWRTGALLSRGFASKTMSAPYVHSYVSFDKIKIAALIAPHIFYLILWLL